jgi:ABC-type microcin C transport system permease subunit YejB
MMGLFAAGTNFFWPATLFQKLAMAGEQKPPAETAAIGRREIIMGHVVRNSILPVITVMGYSFGTAMGGAVLLETVFSYPGVGSLMVESVRARDTQVIVGVVILIACSVVFMNIVVDLLYAWLDPRVGYSPRGLDEQERAQLSAGRTEPSAKPVRA